MSDKFEYCLNWDNVTKNVCQDEKTINKGIIFEDLVEDLISVMFPEEKWKRTQMSYDGKKDFVYPEDAALQEEKWAECKNYTSNLSINIIAPTLIMAAIHGIKDIYIFSRSPLNENAVEGIIAFAKQEKRQVHLIDGNLLESFICKYHSQRNIEHYFPGTNFSAVQDKLRCAKIRVIYSIKDAQNFCIPSSHVFCMGESFQIQILIQNITCEPISFQICENEKHIDVILDAGEIYEYPICDQILHPNNITYSIKIRNKNHKDSLWEQNISLTVSDENYLSWTGHEATRTKDDALKHLQDKVRPALILTAGSGCGKSLLIRLLMEDEQIQSSYRILRLNLDIGRNSWAREFFGQMAGIYGSKETPDDQRKDEQELLSILLNGCTVSAKEIAEKIISFSSNQRPYLLVIDDIQKINPAYFNLIIELESLAQQEKKDLYYLLALNTDELSFNDMLTRLNWDQDFQNRQYVQLKLDKFNDADILTFIQTQYGLQDINSVFSGYQQRITPLELSTFCKGLKSDHIIEKVPGQRIYQIIDLHKFQDVVSSKLYSGHTLESLLDSLMKNFRMETVLKYLYLTGSIREHNQMRFRCELNALLAKGILKNENGEYTFYHSKIREIVGRNLKYSEEDYSDIFEDQDTSLGTKVLCVLYSHAPFKNGIKFLESFFSSFDIIDSPTQRYEICQAIFASAEKLKSANILNLAISFVAKNFNHLNEESDYIKFQKLLYNITRWAVAEQPAPWDDEESVEHIAFFIKKFWDRTLSTHQQEKYKSYFSEIEQCFENLTHISKQRRAFWLCHYANRCAIAMDRESAPLAAESKGIVEQYKRSQDYCNQAGAPQDLRLQLIVDNFYRHYVYRHNLTICHLHQATSDLKVLTTLAEHECEIRDYHLFLFQYLQTKIHSLSDVDSETFLTNLTTAINKFHTEFYQIKLYQLKIYVLCDLRRFSEAEDVLKTALELAYRKDMRTIIYRFTYISAYLAKWRKMEEETIRARKVLALRQILRTYGDFVPSLKREIFLLKDLMKSMNQYAAQDLQKLIDAQNAPCQEMLAAINQNINQDTTLSKDGDLFQMHSYFLINGIDFPTI